MLSLRTPRVKRMELYINKDSVLEAQGWELKLVDIRLVLDSLIWVHKTLLYFHKLKVAVDIISVK